MYFERFPKGQYIIPGTKNYKLVCDLWRRIKIRDKIIFTRTLTIEIYKGVLVSCLAKKQVTSTFVNMYAGRPIANIDKTLAVYNVSLLRKAPRSNKI